MPTRAQVKARYERIYKQPHKETGPSPARVRRMAKAEIKAARRKGVTVHVNKTAVSASMYFPPVPGVSRRRIRIGVGDFERTPSKTINKLWDKTARSNRAVNILSSLRHEAGHIRHDPTHPSTRANKAIQKVVNKTLRHGIPIPPKELGRLQKVADRSYYAAELGAWRQAIFQSGGRVSTRLMKAGLKSHGITKMIPQRQVNRHIKHLKAMASRVKKKADAVRAGKAQNPYAVNYNWRKSPALRRKG